MSFYRPLFFFLLPLTVGCATLTDRHQYVRVVPENRDTEIFYDDEKVGQGPSTIYITRKKYPQIALQKKGKKKKYINLKTDYRWGQSFGGNALLVTYAPIGWILDYTTGSAWEAKDQIQKGVDHSLDANSKLMILPPTGLSSIESRKVGRNIEKWLREKYPETTIVPFKKSFYQSIGMGFDNESEPLLPDPDSLNELIYKTGATHLIFSEYIHKNKQVKIKVYSAYGEKQVDRHFISDVKIEKSNSLIGWMAETGFEFLPNTLSVGTVQTRFSGCANQGNFTLDRYCASYSKFSPLSVISAISLSNILHYRKRQTWHLYLRFYPDLNASFNTVEFSNFTPSSDDIALDWGFVSIGYGPRLSFIVPIGELFMEVSPNFSMNYLKLYSNNYSQTQWKGSGGMTLQMGMNSWISNHWNYRLLARVQVQDLLEDQSLSFVDPGTRFRGGLGIAQLGIMVGYYFHEEKTKLFDWLGFED